MAPGGRNGIDSELGPFLVILFNRYPVVEEILKRYSRIHPDVVPEIGRWKLDDETDFHMCVCAAVEFAPSGDQLGALIDCADEVFAIAHGMLANSLKTYVQKVATAQKKFDAIFDNSAIQHASLIDTEGMHTIRRLTMTLDDRRTSLRLPEVDPFGEDWWVVFRDFFELLDDYERLEISILASIGRLQLAKDKKEEIRHRQMTVRMVAASAIISLLAAGIAAYQTFRDADAGSQSPPAREAPAKAAPAAKPAAQN